MTVMTLWEGLRGFGGFESCLLMNKLCPRVCVGCACRALGELGVGVALRLRKWLGPLAVAQPSGL
jgi:hypothetical protein